MVREIDVCPPRTDEPAKRNRTNNSVRVVRNQWTMGGLLNASHHGQHFLCRVVNSNVTRPLDLIVRLHVYSEWSIQC